VSRRGPRSCAVVIASFGLLAAVLGSIIGRGAAWGDPPGFPSTGSATAGPAGAGSAASPAGPATLDDHARQRIAALRKFARDKENDPKFAMHEAADGVCQIDHCKRIVTLTFNADGTLHCKLSELAEGYQLEVFVLTVKEIYSTGNHYRVTVTPGAPLKTVPIHGASSDVKAMLEVLSSGHLADYSEADWWRAPALYGPYHFDAGTVTVALDEAGVSQETKIAIAPLYPLDLGVVALVGPGLPSYAIVDGKISESRNRTDLSYYFGVHVYPFSWSRNGNRQLRPGRYFSDEYGSWNDRLSLVAGINLGHPTEGGYLGGAIEVYSGISITGGWQPRKYRQLQSGHVVGEMIMGSEVPTDMVWQVSGWGIGLTVDATLVKPLLSFVGK
jgi:hypothetical protein